MKTSVTGYDSGRKLNFLKFIFKCSYNNDAVYNDNNYVQKNISI